MLSEVVNASKNTTLFTIVIKYRCHLTTTHVGPSRDFHVWYGHICILSANLARWNHGTRVSAFKTYIKTSSSPIWNFPVVILQIKELEFFSLRYFLSLKILGYKYFQNTFISYLHCRIHY